MKSINSILDNFSEKMNPGKKKEFFNKKKQIKRFDDILKDHKNVVKALKPPKKVEDLSNFFIFKKKFNKEIEEEKKIKIEKYKNLIIEKYLKRCTSKSLGVLNKTNISKKAKNILEHLQILSKREMKEFDQYWKTILRCTAAKAKPKLFGKFVHGDLSNTIIKDTFINFLEQQNRMFYFIVQSLKEMKFETITLPQNEIKVTQDWIDFLERAALNNDQFLKLNEEIKNKSWVLNEFRIKKLRKQKIEKILFEREISILKNLYNIWLELGTQFELQLLSYLRKEDETNFENFVHAIRQCYENLDLSLKQLSILEIEEINDLINQSKSRLNQSLKLSPFFKNIYKDLENSEEIKIITFK